MKNIEIITTILEAITAIIGLIIIFLPQDKMINYNIVNSQINNNTTINNTHYNNNTNTNRSSNVSSQEETILAVITMISAILIFIVFQPFFPIIIILTTLITFFKVRKTNDIYMIKSYLSEPISLLILSFLTNFQSQETKDFWSDIPVGFSNLSSILESFITAFKNLFHLIIDKNIIMIPIFANIMITVLILIQAKSLFKKPIKTLKVYPHIITTIILILFMFADMPIIENNLFNPIFDFFKNFFS